MNSVHQKGHPVAPTSNLTLIFGPASSWKKFPENQNVPAQKICRSQHLEKRISLHYPRKTCRIILEVFAGSETSVFIIRLAVSSQRLIKYPNVASLISTNLSSFLLFPISVFNFRKILGCFILYIIMLQSFSCAHFTCLTRKITTYLFFSVSK